MTTATMAQDGTIVYGRSIATIARDCGNVKVGSDTITTSRSQASCPRTCPLLGSGCYGENVASAGGKTLFQNVARDNGKTLAGIVARVLSPRRRKAPPRAMRFNVVGDFLDSRGNADVAYIEETNSAAQALRARGTVAWSYTHAWQDGALAPEQFAYVVRASCSNESEVRSAHAAGWHAAVVVKSADDAMIGTRIDGRPVVACPVVTGRVASCADCRLCGRSAAVVAFPVHGVKRKVAARAIARA